MSVKTALSSLDGSILPQLECVRALYYRCIDGVLANEDVTPLASMLKLKSARLARKLTDGCLQFWGG